MSTNPYESPTIPAEVLEPEWPASGCYRDGRFLVLHHTSRLPPICVKTGEPAETQQEHELIGGTPNDGSVPSTRKRWYGDKVYAIQIPLSNNALRRAVWMNRAGVITASLMLLTLFGVAWIARLGRNDFSNVAMISALIGLIASVFLLTEARHQLQLECIARGYFWISKIPRKYLEQLPAWPVPRPSFWQRALFGPAGVSGPPATPPQLN